MSNYATSPSRHTASFVLPAAMALCVGCAAGPGIPLGLGPVGDTLPAILIFAAVVVLGYRYFTARSGSRTEAGTADTAEAIARERYAKGDITLETYQQILQALRRR